MIYCLDQSVGRILDALERMGLANNTIVMLASDNGGVGGYSNLGIQGAHEITSNLPFKGGKTQLYEGGTRVPFIAKWSGVIPPGTISDTPAMMIDLFPTFIELAGAAAPPQHKAATDELSLILGAPKEFQLDGVSLVKHLKTGGRTPLPARDLFWFFPAYCGAPDGPTRLGWRSTPQSTIRTAEGFKFTEYYHDGTGELCDMRHDPYELTNLITNLPDKALGLRDKLHQWQRDVDARPPIPKGKNESFDAANQPWATGLKGLPLTPEHARLLYYRGELGLFITDAPYSSVGLKAGWILLEIAGQPTRSIADFRRAMADVKPGDTVRYSYSNGIKTKTGKLGVVVIGKDSIKPKKKKANKESLVEE